MGPGGGAAGGLAKPDLFVVARFLGKLWQPDWAAPVTMTKARLQRAVNLNYTVFTKYLDFLSQRGFVEVRDRGDSTDVALTDEGRRVYRALVEWLERIVGPGSW